MKNRIRPDRKIDGILETYEAGCAVAHPEKTRVAGEICTAETVPNASQTSFTRSRMGTSLEVGGTMEEIEKLFDESIKEKLVLMNHDL